MKSNLMTISDEAVWLEKRKTYVTSTETAALFGVEMASAPSAFELFHIKRKGLDHEFEDNNRMFWGRTLEPALASGIQKQTGWTVRPMRVFAFDDEDKIGSSYDNQIDHPDRGLSLLEIKTIDYKNFKEKFIEGEDGELEAPPFYEIQCQTELEVMNRYEWCLLAIFIMDTRDMKYIWIKRDREMGAEIRKAVKEFWAREDEPDPSWRKDASLIAKIYHRVDAKLELDATEMPEINQLCIAYKSEKAIEYAAGDNAREALGKLLYKLGENRYTFTNDFKVTAAEIISAGKVITQDMVGQTINARDPYKRLTVTPLKKADKAA